MLQTLAESTQRISEELKATEPEVRWQQIAAFRNILTHEYVRIDREIIWTTIEEDLPPLEAAIERMVERATNAERETWRIEMNQDWPRYEFTTTESGFTLTRQENAEADREHLGDAQSVDELAELERLHRGWPEESLDDIISYTNAEIQRSKSKGITRG